MKTIHGTYDGHTVIPDEPLDVPANTRVRITVEDGNAAKQPNGTPVFRRTTPEEVRGCLVDGRPATTAKELQEIAGEDVVEWQSRQKEAAGIPPTSVDEIAGKFRYEGEPKTEADFEEGIRKGAWESR